MNKPHKLGTILPTEKSLAANDRYAEKEFSLNKKFAGGHPILKHCAVATVGGEIRYQLDGAHYATVRHQKAKWFERREDGFDYATTEEKIKELLAAN